MSAVRRCLYATLVLSAAACGCTLAGCFGALTLNTAEVAEWSASDSFSLRLCVATDCDERQVDSSTEELLVFDLNGPDDLAQGRSVPVTLTVDSPGGTREASAEVTLEVMSPNGPACGPACVSGHLTPIGDDLEAGQP